MIAKSEGMPLVIKACPSFKKKWAKYLAEVADHDEQLHFILQQDLIGKMRHWPPCPVADFAGFL